MEGGAKIVGVFRVKNHDFTPINLIFSNFRGGGYVIVSTDRCPLDGGCNTNSLDVVHNGCRMWRVPCLLHEKDHFCRFSVVLTVSYQGTCQ